MDESERLWRVKVGEKYAEVGLCVPVVIFLWIVSLLAGYGQRMEVVALIGIALCGAFVVVAAMTVLWQDTIATYRRLRGRDYDDPSW